MHPVVRTAIPEFHADNAAGSGYLFLRMAIARNGRAPRTSGIIKAYIIKYE